MMRTESQTFVLDSGMDKGRKGKAHLPTESNLNHEMDCHSFISSLGRLDNTGLENADEPELI